LSSELIYDDTVSGALLSCSEQVDSIGGVAQQPFLSSPSTNKAMPQTSLLDK
jgi:hypothetical protein